MTSCQQGLALHPLNVMTKSMILMKCLVTITWHVAGYYKRKFTAIEQRLQQMLMIGCYDRARD
jgi:hypothetical protein